MTPVRNSNYATIPKGSPAWHPRIFIRPRTRIPLASNKPFPLRPIRSPTLAPKAPPVTFVPPASSEATPPPSPLAGRFPPATASSGPAGWLILPRISLALLLPITPRAPSGLTEWAGAELARKGGAKKAQGGSGRRRAGRARTGRGRGAGNGTEQAGRTAGGLGGWGGGGAGGGSGRGPAGGPPSG